MMKYALIIAIIALSTSAYAGIYKWIDENGQVHYGESPPGKNSREMNIQSNPGRSDDKEKYQQQLENQNKFLKALEEERAFKNKLEEEENKRLQAQKVREKYCLEMRHELRDMEVGGVVWYDLDDKGERVFLSDKEVASKKQELRDRIKSECVNQANK